MCFLKGYNADVGFFQECDAEFFFNELKETIKDEYWAEYWPKSGLTEGEAIIFRKNRFKYSLYFLVVIECCCCFL